MFRPIYEPRTRAREYCDLAVNIYNGCPHGCTYCYAPAVLRRKPENFHKAAVARPGIVEAVRAQLAAEGWKSKKIMLCFTCDPYPLDCDSWATRKVIQAIKESGNHVQILTKGDIRDARRDFPLLDANDSFGVTLTGAVEWQEPGAARHWERIRLLREAAAAGIPTWVSCEPVIDQRAIEDFIVDLDFVGMWRIGKLNHRKSETDWRQFGIDIEALCKRLGRNYYIKEDLRAAMNGEKREKNQYVSNIKSTVESGIEDDGVSQGITVKKGIASVGSDVLPNPVTLRPFRTFTEVEQPASKFVFRCNDSEGMKFCLVEADGGAWRGEAMKNIKGFLATAVPGLNVIA